MTPDERTLLQRFLQDLVQSRAQGKDAEADALIADALRSSPDAAYLLVQHAILSDQALHAAQAQVAQLQQQVSAQSQAQAQPPASFLPQEARANPWGQAPRPNPWGQAASQPPPPQPAYQPQPGYPPQASPYMGPGPFSSGGGLGSFLRQAATTAAGVAGGEMLFSGLSGLFGGHPFGGGYGMMAPPVEENITNNYYDDSGQGGFDQGDQGGGWDGGGSGGNY